MKQADVVSRFLFPPHENAAVAVQPRVDSLDDPASRLVSALTLLSLFASRADVWRVAAASRRVANRLSVVAFVTTKMLRTTTSRARPRNRNAVESSVDESLIVNIGTGHGQANRHATPIG